MDANAYLRKHGWQGTGHSLDNHGRGIKKPLLIAHKQDQLGLGKKKAAHNVDDQWWMRAFDESLKNIGTGQDSTLTQVRKQGINRGGLYGFFVKGEVLVSTMEEESSAVDSSGVTSSTPTSRSTTPPTSASEAAKDSTKASKKRKREAEGGLEKNNNKKRNSKTQESQSSAALVDAAILKRIGRDVKKTVKARHAAGEYGATSGKKEKYLVQKKMRADKRKLKAELIGAALKQREIRDAKAPMTAVTVQALGPSKAKKDKPSKKSKSSEPVVSIEQSTVQIIENEGNVAITAKIAKLTVAERSQYEERAKLKSQSLEEYVRRRIEKKDSRRAGKT